MCTFKTLQIYSKDIGRCRKSTLPKPRAPFSVLMRLGVRFVAGVNYRVLVSVLAKMTTSPLCKNVENALASSDNVLIYRHSRDGPLQHLNAIFHRLKEMVLFEFLLFKML